MDDGKKFTFVYVPAIARLMHGLVGFSTSEPLGTIEGKVKELKFSLLIDL